MLQLPSPYEPLPANLFQLVEEGPRVEVELVGLPEGWEKADGPIMIEIHSTVEFADPKYSSS